MRARISNVGIECPDPQRLASFYAELLGMHVLRTDWLMIGTDDEQALRLAFDEAAEYRRPTWPNPEQPQQLHLDIAVRELPAAEGLVQRLGAVRLPDLGDCPTYADPAGHPFCIYADALDDLPADAPLGRIENITVDCPAPQSLASFYAELLDMPERRDESEQWVLIDHAGSAPSAAAPPTLGFQAAAGAAPRWPDPAYPQQLHFDISVDDSTAAGELALRLGATRLPDLGGSCPVYADPFGHPFCLCGPGE